MVAGDNGILSYFFTKFFMRQFCRVIKDELIDFYKFFQCLSLKLKKFLGKKINALEILYIKT